MSLPVGANGWIGQNRFFIFIFIVTCGGTLQRLSSTPVWWMGRPSVKICFHIYRWRASPWEHGCFWSRIHSKVQKVWGQMVEKETVSRQGLMGAVGSWSVWILGSSGRRDDLPPPPQPTACSPFIQRDARLCKKALLRRTNAICSWITLSTDVWGAFASVYSEIRAPLTFGGALHAFLRLKARKSVWRKTMQRPMGLLWISAGISLG